ncbi:hypothetical protein Tco_0233414 [Tanacetum coccineum]
MYQIHGMRRLRYLMSKIEGGVWESVSLKEGGEKCGLDSKEDEVLPKVDDVSLIDGVFDGVFGGEGNEYFIIGEGLEEYALVEAMEKEGIKEDDEENEGDDYLIKMRWINVVRQGYSDFGFQMVFRKMQKCSWG